MHESLMLFDDSVGSISPAHPPSPAPVEEDFECTDAQLFLLQGEDMGGPPQHISDDDETQVPTAGAFCNVQTDEEGRGHEWVEDDVEADEVLDPDWTEGRASDMCSSVEKAVVAQRQQHNKRGSRVQKGSRHSRDSTPATAYRTQAPSTPRPAPRSSLAWQFFTQCPDDKTQVVCMLPEARHKRS